MARSRSGTPAALAGLGDELETIRDDLARLGEHVARMMRSTGSDAVDETRAQVHRMRESVDRMIADAGSRGRDAAHAMRNAGEQIGGALEHSVRTRPFATVALALGLGIVIGAIYRR